MCDAPCTTTVRVPTRVGPPIGYVASDEVNMWLLLLACSASDEVDDATCPGAAAAEVGGCLVSEAGTQVGEERYGFATWAGSGTVLEVGDGACESEYDLGHFGPQGALSWARVEVGGETWRVGVSIPGWTLPVVAGDTLAIGWDTAEGDIREGRLTLRDRDGALVVWVVDTWSEDAGPSELTIAVAEEATCLVEGDGWEKRRFALVAKGTVIGPGEVAEVDAWRVHNVDVAESACDDCEDGVGWLKRYAVTSD